MPHAQEDQTDAQRVAQATVIYLECLFSIMVWDWLASLPTEWHLVWLPVTKSLRATEKDAASRAPLQVKLLRSASLLCFVVVRYLALIEFALFVWAVNVVWTYDECARIQHFFPYASGLVALAANGIMCLRVMAIWSRDRLVSMSLGGMLVVVVALVLWGCQYTSPPEGITACIPTPTSTHLNVLYLAPMVYDFIILVLTLTRAIMLNRSGLIGPLLRTIVRDGILYFFAVFTCNLLAVVFELQTAQPLLRPINASLATIGTSIFCSKIFFALKRATSAQIKRNQSQSLPSSGPYPLNAIPPFGSKASKAELFWKRELRASPGRL
ncbi:hypothetical protein IE81DRAFT_327748 [Ceraceosorus guamensis]|uniref:Uncharacterized protein n=1 Tax=Ceraceosorus guamensis TaxID=1522189 RepID=A0A316W7W5_9BASI|nr:hypothetical protein IE81DRAFT_327748 [Ceraceosorus guamensis]PWN45912.1 hypothetical protein IE81DRAFT_327748 [Ceraceosorus guamensis]